MQVHGSITAGWAIIGLQSALREAAWKFGLEIELHTSCGLIDRRVDYRLTGDESSIGSFQRGLRLAVASAQRASM